MTRNYNNSRRGGAGPSSRNYSPGRPGERRSQHTPRPARPRPHRDSTTHEREAGAAPNHTGYRPRTPKGPSSQRNWRNRQPTEHSSTDRGPRPFSSRQDNSQRFDRSPRSNTNHHGPRSFGTDRRTSDNPRDEGRRGYTGNPNRKGFRDNPNNEQRSEYREHDRERTNISGNPKGFRDNRNNEQRPAYHDRNRERTYKQDSSQRSTERSDRQSREFQRGDRFSRNITHNRHAPQPDIRNPRRPSRPSEQSNNSFRRRPDFAQRPYGEAQFEGDYERFHDSDEQLEERHVTRMPDGRVLKGSRPAQRRQERFWTDIADETEDLIQPAKNRQVGTGKPAQRRPSPKTGTPKTPSKPRTHKASAVVRGKKSRGKQATAKPRSTGPKPSQRGFKWPTHKQS